MGQQKQGEHACDSCSSTEMLYAVLQLMRNEDQRSFHVDAGDGGRAWSGHWCCIRSVAGPSKSCSTVQLLA
jgi:hypothetical protein